MGITYSVVQPQQQSAKKTDLSSVKEVEQDQKEEDVSSKLDHVYVLCHNKTICSYIEDKDSIESSINHYMKRVFTNYISRWDSFNFYIVRRAPLEESNMIDDYGLMTSVTLMSRSKNFILSYDRVEEVLEIYKIPRFVCNSLSEEEDTDEEEEEESEEESEEEESETEEEELVEDQIKEELKKE